MAKYKPLSRVAASGRKVAVKPSLERAWDEAQASLPPRFRLKELCQYFYLLSTPWGVSFTLGESSITLQSGCCKTHFTRPDDGHLSCGKCKTLLPFPRGAKQRSNWDDAAAWLEKTLMLLGHDPLVATLEAGMFVPLRRLAEEPSRSAEKKRRAQTFPPLQPRVIVSH